jgi:D-3-phosphoglycerate dehydrogenase / 2-oxoglutarate reductase
MHKIHTLNKISKIGLSKLPFNYQLEDDINLAEAVIVRSASMHEINLNDQMLAVARAGAGYNNIPIDKYGDHGIVCFNTPGANANAVKELTLAGLFLASRDIYGGMKWLENNKEDEEIAKTVEKVKSQFAGIEIYGKTIGIIGLGAIGMMLAKSCLALGMKVIGTKRDLSTIKDSDLDPNMTLVQSKEELFPLADFISLNLPLTKDTKHIINKKSFQLMKDQVIILNFARDQLVNDEDLKDALESNKVKYYVTDFPNFQTVNMKNVIAIPHLGASTEEAEDNCAMMAIDQIINYIEDGNIINSVNFPNLDAGKKIGQNRLTILYKSHLDLKNIIFPYMANKDIILEKDRMNANYGYMVLDINDDISEDLLMIINNISGVVKVRMI